MENLSANAHLFSSGSDLTNFSIISFPEFIQSLLNMGLRNILLDYNGYKEKTNRARAQEGPFGLGCAYV